MNTFKTKTLRGAAIVAFLATGIMPTQAQTTITSNDWELTNISKAFSYTGRPQLLYSTAFNENKETVQVYDENLEPLKEFTCTLAECKNKIVTEERLVIPGEYDDIVMGEWTAQVDGGLVGMIDRANQEGCTSHTTQGNVHTFMPSELPEGEGAAYRKLVYTEGATEYTIYDIQRFPKYSDWQVTDERMDNYYYYGSPYLYNFDNDIAADAPYYRYGFFTQTMFNTDDKYEYLVPVYELSTTSDDIYELNWAWRPNNEQILIKREVRYGSNLTATNVVTDDGNVIYTFPGQVRHIVIMGGKTYAVVIKYTESNTEQTFYEIDPTSSSVKAVRTSDVKISPRALRRSENVTIETGETDAKVSREVVVTSADGRVIDRRTIPAGVTSTQISTGRMASGLYNFTVYAKGKRLENGKIIVR